RRAAAPARRAECVGGPGREEEQAGSGAEGREAYEVEHAARGEDTDLYDEAGDDGADMPAGPPADESDDAAGGDQSQEHRRSGAAASPDDEGSHQGLIDSLPWNVPALRAAGSEAESHTPPAAPEHLSHDQGEAGATSESAATVGGEEDPLDVTLMTGSGVHTPQTGAPWAGDGDLAGVAGGLVDEDAADEGDHDGHTVLGSQAREPVPGAEPGSRTEAGGGQDYSAVVELPSGHVVDL